MIFDGPDISTKLRFLDRLLYLSGRRRKKMGATVPLRLRASGLEVVDLPHQPHCSPLLTTRTSAHRSERDSPPCWPEGCRTPRRSERRMRTSRRPPTTAPTGSEIRPAHAR